MWRSRRQGIDDEALLVALAERLRRMAGAVNPRAEFQSSLRTSLTMEASTALVPDPAPAGTSTVRTVRVLPRGRMAVATAVVGAALGLGGMASASASALPGDSLYPIKRVTEQVELAFHRDLADRGAFKLELAERRLDEARELSKRGSDYSDLAAESLREFEEAATDGTADLVAAFRAGNGASMALLSGFAARTDARLDALASDLPPGSTDVVDSARESLQAIDSRTEQLCPTCGAGSEDLESVPARRPGRFPAEPEPEPAGPPPAESPAVPPAPAPPASAPTAGSSTSAKTTRTTKTTRTRSEDEDADEELAAPAPTPVPTPEPTPAPTPEPTRNRLNRLPLRLPLRLRLRPD